MGDKLFKMEFAKYLKLNFSHMFTNKSSVSRIFAVQCGHFLFEHDHIRIAIALF
jgi:hypothetical protein